MLIKFKRIMVVILCLTMVLAAVPATNVEAATTKISKCKITLSKTSYNFTGSQCKPKVTVKYKGKKLKSGKDYTVSYSNNIYAGTATVKVKGKGKYSGSVSKKFSIKNKLSVTIDKPDVTYTGKAFKPRIKVKSGKTKLSAKDYSVSYKNNKNAGNGYVIVKGKGKYKGKNASATFVIQSRHIVETEIDIPGEVEYTGKECKPEVKATYNGMALKEGTDFKVKYTNNVNKGRADVEITGIGNYMGDAKRSFNIGEAGDSGDEDSITVDRNNEAYDVASDISETGKLKEGQRADNILSGFKVENGETGLNHPNGIASDGTHFVVCDTWNNRVLVYNTLPTKNTKPSVVIGQKDFKSFTAGGGEDQLNWPVSAIFAGKKLIIADTHNNRLLVYNTVPTTNGAKADSVIKSMSATDDLVWPWAVWSDGTKLIATSTRSGKIAFWDNVESAVEGKYADKVIVTNGTPRTIVSDGNYLLIGDHNLNGGGEQGSYIWKKYPTSSSSKPDFTIDVQYGGAIINGDFYGIANDSNYYIYDGLIDSKGEKPATTFGNIKGYMQAGDYNQIVYVGGKTYVCYYNSSVVAIYNGKVNKENYMAPMGYLGTDVSVKSATVANGLYQNPIPATDGKSLVLVDDYNRLIAVYKKIPNTNNVKADVVYNFGSHWDYPIDIAIDSNGKMFVLTAKAVLVWNKVPLNGEMYDSRIELDYDINKDGSRIEADDSFLYIYSKKDSRVYKFDKNAKDYSFARALQSVPVSDLRNLSSNGNYLLIAGMYEAKITVLKTHDLSKYGEVYSSDMGNHLNLPTDARLLPNGQLAVVDANRMRVWNSLDEAIGDKNLSKCISLGTLDNYSISYKDNGSDVTDQPSLATDGSLFTPTSLAYAKGHLWVGEFKFSARLVRYDLK